MENSNISMRAARASISESARGSFSAGLNQVDSLREKSGAAIDVHGDTDFAHGSVSPTFDKDGQPLEFAEKADLRRGLQQRHIQMIALAGTIGTGLFLSSGKAVGRGGPLGAFLGYTFTGFLASCVVFSIAELSALVPLSGGVIRHADYFVDPALAFANGWNLVYGYLVSIPAECVAAAVIIEFWTSSVSNGVWITVLGLLLIGSNLCFVRVYGELEFTFATLKIMLIVGINIMALVITCGGGPDHTSIGFRFWKNPGPFVDFNNYQPSSLGQFLGFWTVFSNAIYAYSGIENISLAAAETQSPRRNIPTAARRILVRVLLFYVLTIFMVGLVVPSNDPNLFKGTGAARSPFVIAANRAGIKVVPSIINAVILTSAWSSGNSSLLGGSRILYGLARDGNAPKIFTRTSRWGVPYVAVAFISLFICLAYMSLSAGASVAFEWLQDLVSVSTIFNWLTILTVYLRFYYGCKKQGISRSELPWAAPFQPYLAWIGFIGFIVLFLTGGYVTFTKHHWNDETFVSSYVNLPIFFILYFVYKFWKKTKIVTLEAMPIRGFIQLANDHPEPIPEKLVGWKKINLLWS